MFMVPRDFTEDLFDDFMRGPAGFDKEFFGGRNPLYGKHGKNLMKTDVQESEKAYTISVDMPGFSKDDVTLELENGMLTISAAKNLNKDEQDEKGNYIRRERYMGSCSRSFYVGKDVKTEDVKAKMKDGILQLEVPKAAPAALPEKKTILIEE